MASAAPASAGYYDTTDAGATGDGGGDDDTKSGPVYTSMGAAIRDSGAAPTSSGGYSFVIAVDGSEMAHNAFLTGYSLMRKGDTVEIVHAATPSKDYLPLDLRPEGVFETYEIECVSKFPKDKYRVVVWEKDPKLAARESVCAYVNKKAHVDFLVVGFVGRKGPKLDATILGSMADYSLRGAHCSSIIVKNRKPPAKVHTFLACVDGSNRAHEGMEIAMSLAKKGDQVIVLHVEEEPLEDLKDDAFHTTAIQERYTKDTAELAAKEDAPKVSFQVIKTKAGIVVADLIVDFAIENEVTEIVIGVDGLKAHVLGKKVYSWGSVSDRVVTHARCNVIACQTGLESKTYS